MAKYDKFMYKDSCELIFVHGQYKVYKTTNRMGLLFLVKNENRLSEKQFRSKEFTDNDYRNWIARWEKNAAEQIGKLEDRIRELRREQEQIREALVS